MHVQSLRSSTGIVLGENQPHAHTHRNEQVQTNEVIMVLPNVISYRWNALRTVALGAAGFLSFFFLLLCGNVSCMGVNLPYKRCRYCMRNHSTSGQIQDGTSKVQIEDQERH